VTIVNATASAKANEKGFVKEIDVELAVYSDAPEERLRTVVERAEKGCYVRGLLKDNIDYKLNLTIRSAT
jgi:uncharacterized OsmC-like protein